jgi:hypothetical protein
MPVAALAGLLATAALVAGCGGESDNGGTQKPPPVAKPEDFPKAAGKTLPQLAEGLSKSGPVLAPSVSQLTVGSNRFGFGLFDRARAQIADAPAAIYVAPVGGDGALGPFPAKYESLAVKAQFRSRTVASDPDSAKSVYVAHVKFPHAGQYQVIGMLRLDDRLVVATPAGAPLKVRKKGQVPAVGDPAPRTHTPTVASVGGNQSKIDTREPPGTMHDVDFADVVGRKPTMLLFATPALCQSRVCGPVVDIAEQVKAETKGGGAAWIHMEIYRDNELEKGFRPQVTAWRLPTEPWLFAIDRRGRIAAEIEGAFSARELRAALAKATGR